MISTQTFENYPEFANAGQKSQPNDAKYAAGFIPSDVLPAEWLNWFLSGATKGVTALNTGVKSIEQEINAVLASRAVTPDITATNQLLTVLNKIKAEAVLAAHPVGSLYWTSKNENPAVTFGGGTWKQITDKFVLAAGSTYKAESTGGAPRVQLTIANLPAHNHTFTPSGTIKSTFTGSAHSHTFTPSGSISDTIAGGNININGTHKHTINDPGHKHKIPGYWSSFAGGDYNVLHEGGIGSLTTNVVKTGITMDDAGTHTHLFKGSPHTHTFTGTQIKTSATQDGTVSSSFTGNSGNTGGVGSGSSISIMPPYVVKYCWERTA